MSKQTFTPAHRRAIWTAYGKQCFYCREPLRWDELRIDHLVPEYLAGDTNKLRTLLLELGLPDTWDLQADANLVAACDRCNAFKHDQIPAPNQTILLITRTRKKADRVEGLRKKFEVEERTDELLAQLEGALALGRVTKEDVDRMRLLAEAAPDAPVRLLASIQIVAGVAFTELRPSEVERLLDLPVLHGAYQHLPEGLDFYRGYAGNDVRMIKTSREYRDAIADGYHPRTNFGGKMAAFFTRTLGVLTAIQACRPAERSFIREPRVGVCDVDLLPSSLLIFWNADEAAHDLIRTHRTIGALVQSGAAKVVSIGSHELTIEFSNLRTSCREMLLADLDGDGCEDILISQYASAVGGSYGEGFEPSALARRGTDELFTATSIVPVPPLGDGPGQQEAQARVP